MVGLFLVVQQGLRPALALAAASIVALLVGRAAVPRFGPRHLILLLLPIEALALAVLGLVPYLSLPPEVLVVDAVMLGAAGALHALAEMRWKRSSLASSLPAAVLPLLLAGLVAMGFGPVWVGPALGPLLLVAAAIIQREPDPARPGPTPLAPFLPWRRADGSRPAGLARPWWRRAPATLCYLVFTTVAYAFWVARYDADSTKAPAAFVQFFVYRIPEFAQRPDLVLLHLFTSVWINWHIVQLGYVIVLLTIAGLRFEAREGTRRVVAVFYLTSITAGLVAGALLFAIHPWLHAAWVDRAWEDVWTGGSAGAFGLLGAMAARCRRPWLLLATAATWELNVAIFLLRSYTPAFHLTAMVAGFLLMRTVFRTPSKVPMATTTGTRRL